MSQSGQPMMSFDSSVSMGSVPISIKKPRKLVVINDDKKPDPIMETGVSTKEIIEKIVVDEKALEDVKKEIEKNVCDNGKEVLSHLGEYIEEPYHLIESYFQGQHLERLVRHQIESYNHFINYQIQRTINMFNPVVIRSENDYVEERGQYFLEANVSFENFKLYPPQIHENNGATKMMLPQEAKLRNFTYASGMTVDVKIKYIIRNTENMDTPKIIEKTLPKINIGKMPIMVKSYICVLTQNKHLQPSFTGECKMDCGGYFIIKGSEKTVLGQERAAENRVYCFDGKNTTKWNWFAEIKSIPDYKCISPKQIEMMIASKNNGFGHGIYVTVPRIKQPIELFVLFRALGIISDKEICQYILLDIEEEKNGDLLKCLQASVIDANKYLTQEDAIRHITSFVAYTPFNMDRESGLLKKREFALEVLNNDLFPHCQTMTQKIYMLGYMCKKLIQTSMGWIPCDDRDSYLNKRIELTGTLLNNLFRNYFNKLVKEMQKQVVREINNGSWRSTEDYENIINMTNIYKIMKSTTIENGITRALSTGDFSIKQANSSKVGVAQVLNRLTYVASLSHLRRINTPLEKSGELIAPRKLHNTTFGFLCLTGDTEVLLSDRLTIKKIKDMKDGDRVTTVNPETLLDEPSDIHSFFCKMPDKLFEITTISGRKIKATANHPFLVNNNGKYEWKNVEDLQQNDAMFVRDFKENNYKTDLLESVNEIQPELVYDFTTRSDNHSFVASSFVTHNCPAETPEGQSIGIVKNISYMGHITIPTNSSSLYEYVKPYAQPVDNTLPADLYNKVKVFINGCWVGVSETPIELYTEMKNKKYKGIINIYTSIIFDYKLMEIRICNDGGRLTRPVLRVRDNKALLDHRIIDKLKNKEITWNDLLTSCKIEESIVEYIDPEEQNFSLIAMKAKHGYIQDGNQKISYSHCEIHPSTIFGVLASCIPFPEHNQAPRNTYQSAMAKQAIGVYATNYDHRMDKTAYVLSYPTRPLVETRVMNFIHLNQIPSGCQIHVAIMTHTGYNQEDSVLVNKGSIDRGLFMATIYHTEKDEDKNIIRDEIIRCKPDKTKTKGIKFGNYDKLNNQGFIPENSLVENRDVIIAKIIPIKENRNDPTKVIKYEDQSKTFRTTEETYIDKNYTGRNGDGYNFAKVRVRILRKPNYGDKFCALPTQQVLTDHGWMQICDIDITKHKVCSIGTDGNMIYEYPTAKFEYDHNDKMYSIKNKQIEIVCTLNHRLYVQKRNGKNYELIEAKDVMGKMVRFQKSLENAYPDVPTIRIGDVDYDMDTWLQFVGMFISDGSCDTNVNGIYITALKERKIEFNTSIFEKLGVNYSYHNSGNFYISGSKYPDVYEEFKKLSVGALNKYLPDFIWNLSKRQSIVLLEALLQGDGTTMKYKGEDEFSRYGTISIRLANDISRLAVHCGWSGIIKIAEEPTGIARTGKRNLGSRAGTEVSIIQKHTYYKVSIIRKQNQPWINKKKNESNKEELIDYNGKVYCIEMPSSHTYYMRETENSPSLIIGNSSRHGQKGTCGNIIPECDMPFTKNGLRPDIIINPHAIPSRMTIAQLKETLLGKVLLELGMFGDGTSFGDLDVKTIINELQKLGYESYGNEVMYNGLTGEQLETSIFIGPVFYQRLKHMVSDKQHSRAIGPMVNLTRQPAEGRSRDGGFRIGEMERDVMIAHGMSKFCKERLYDVSDKYSVHVCKKCGMIASYNDGNKNSKYANGDFSIHLCNTCNNMTDFAKVNIPYAYKLLSQELQTINIVPRIITE
jgi:DNA-directed RNA polymerase beta subunit